VFASKFHSTLYSLQNIVDLISRLSDRQKTEIQQLDYHTLTVPHSSTALV
jgi:hypothetical protein